MALDLHAVCDVHLIGDHVEPLHDVQAQLPALLSLLDQYTAVLSPRMAHAVEEDGKVGLIHPVAVFHGEEEGLGLCLRSIAEYGDCLGVSRSVARVATFTRNLVML